MRTIGKPSDTASSTGTLHAKLSQALTDIAAVDVGAVPSADSGDNVDVCDVVGNKTDTTGGDSLVSLVKICDAAVDVVDGLQDVPSQNSADNNQMRDVIGNKTDTTAGDSLVALVLQAIEQVKQPRSGALYGLPNGSAGVTVAGHANAWTVGNWTEIDDGTGITADMVLVGLQLDTPSDAAIVGSIDISHTNGTNTIVAQGIPFEIASDAGQYVPISLPPGVTIPSGEEVEARIQTAAGGAESIVVKVIVQAIG